MLKTKAMKHPLDLQVQLTMGFGFFWSVTLDENVFHLTALSVRLEGRDKTCSQVMVMLLNKNMLNVIKHAFCYFCFSLLLYRYVTCK